MDEKTERANALRAVRREAERFATQRERLHAAIVRADSVGVPKLHIAEASKLSREWISQLIKRAERTSADQSDAES